MGQGEVGKFHLEGDNTWQLLQLAEKKPWSIPGVPLGLENTTFAL